ncbi:MAG: hypothetical protein ACAH81_12505 [Actinomycetota bacterium]
MPGTRIRAIALVLALMLAAAPARASDEVRRRGSCSGGPGDWTLRVRRDDGALRVRFTIDDVAAGQPWQLFLSDNGTRIFSGTKSSDATGEVRVSKRTVNRAGSDRIAASGVNTVNGTTCEGSLTY